MKGVTLVYQSRIMNENTVMHKALLSCEWFVNIAEQGRHVDIDKSRR